jgi:hypothetical protein
MTPHPATLKASQFATLYRDRMSRRLYNVLNKWVTDDHNVQELYVEHRLGEYSYAGPMVVREFRYIYEGIWGPAMTCPHCGMPISKAP